MNRKILIAGVALMIMLGISFLFMRKNNNAPNSHGGFSSKKVFGSLNANRQKELQDLMLSYGADFGLKMIMYQASHAGNLPPQEAVIYHFTQYTRNRDKWDISAHTKEIVRWAQMSDAANPLLAGTLDAGYGWRIEIYKDGVAKLVCK